MTAEPRRRLLIASRNLALLRAHHDDLIVALVQAGVDVSIRYRNDKQLSANDYRESLLRRGCTVTVQPLPRDLRPSRRQRRPEDLLAYRLRQLANLLRYYDPDYRGRDWLRERWFPGTSPGPRRWARRLGKLGTRVPRVAIRLAHTVDRLLPASEPARVLITDEQPDGVVTVAMVRNPELVDVLKAAVERGIPTGSWIQSWDNLTNKGLLHFVPDRVFVWNTIQREELRRYHFVPERNVCVTGAQSFDYWFDGDPPSSRDAFCAEAGLDPDRPIVLYLSSSRLIEPRPGVFFLRWLEAIRSSDDETLRDAFVLVRPHPLDLRHWADLDVRDPRLAVSPSAKEAPAHSAAFRRRYRDDLHHCSVAVGINTSAMIEAAILGKPVCTVELPELADRQRGTVHFQYLMSAGDGLLRSSPSLDDHLAVLGELVRRDPYERDTRSARFVEAFVRPHGIDVKPGDVFLAEMLQLLERPCERKPVSGVARAGGRLVDVVAPLLGAPFEDRAPHRLARLARSQAIRARVKRIRHLTLVVPAGIAMKLRRRRPSADSRPESQEAAEDRIPAGR